MSDSGFLLLSLALASVAIICLWMLVRQSRRGRGAGIFLLAALPLALLFLAVPVPLIAIKTIMSFETLARSRQPALDGLAISIVRPLWAASLGCVVTLCVIAGVRWFAVRSAEPSKDDTVAQPDVRTGWGHWIILPSAILAVPVLVLAATLAETGSLLAETSAAMRSRVSAGTVLNDMNVRDAGNAIAARLVVAMFGGVFVSFLVLGSAVLNPFAIRSSAPSESVEKLSWVVFGVVSIAVVWILLNLTSAIQTIPSIAPR